MSGAAISRLGLLALVGCLASIAWLHPKLFNFMAKQKNAKNEPYNDNDDEASDEKFVTRPSNETNGINGRPGNSSHNQVSDIFLRKVPPIKAHFIPTNDSNSTPSMSSLLFGSQQGLMGDKRLESMNSNSRSYMNSNSSLTGDKRIVGGTTAEAGAYPTYAFTAGAQLCGSTLIWYDVLLTAAHCDGAFLDGVLIGGLMLDGSDGRFIAVNEEYPHPDYNFDTGK